jgi:hypothetical protein
MKLSFLAVLVILAGCSKPAPKLPASATVKVGPAIASTGKDACSGTGGTLAPPIISTAGTATSSKILIGTTNSCGPVSDVAPPAPRKKAEKMRRHIDPCDEPEQDVCGESTNPEKCGKAEKLKVTVDKSTGAVLVDGKPVVAGGDPCEKPSPWSYFYLPEIPKGYRLLCADYDNCRLVKK